MISSFVSNVSQLKVDFNDVTKLDIVVWIAIHYEKTFTPPLGRHYLRNSIDAKNVLVQFIKVANSMTESRGTGGKDPALSWVDSLLILFVVNTLTVFSQFLLYWMRIICCIYKDFVRQLKAFLPSLCHLCACEMSPGVGAFDHLNGPLCGAFERHFGPGRGGDLNNNFCSKYADGVFSIFVILNVNYLLYL